MNSGKINTMEGNRMDINIKDIERLNKEIESLMKERTKANAQKEVWEKQLNDGISSYMERYGVDLSGSSIAEVKNKLLKEFKAVKSKVQEEYDFSQKVISYINNGDIREARKLLGLDLGNEYSDTDSDVEEKEVGSETGNLVSTEEAFRELEEMNDSEFFGEADEEAEENIEVVAHEPQKKQKPVEEEKVSEDVKKPVGKVNFSIFFDDDDDEGEVPGPKGSKKEEPVKKEKPSEGVKFSLEDDETENNDDIYGDFGGFGNLIKGSKFDF